MIKEEDLDLYGWDSDLSASKSGTWSAYKDLDSEKNEPIYYITVTPHKKQYLLGELINNNLIFEGDQLEVLNFRGSPIGLLLSKKE